VSRTASPPIRRSIEVEYWVTDRDGRLTPAGDLLDASPGADQEFVEPLVEIKTTPCETTRALREELFTRLADVLDRADDRDKRVVPLATPLGGDDVTERPSDRTRVQNRVVGDDFAYVRHCAGTHIHVEQQPGRAVDQLNTLIALDPALALVNSAPYFDGRRLATGARSKLYRRMAYADVPHQGWLWRYVDDTDEWDRRLERRYDDFVTAAVEAGVDRRTVEANFDPESAIWTPVQFRETFGTVEWRSPDAALPTQVVRLADDVAAVVDRLRDADVTVGGSRGVVSVDEIALPDFDTVLGYVDEAIDPGLDSPALRSYLGRMGFDVDAYQPLSPTLDASDSLTPADVRRLRLDAADRLERDVLQVEPARGD
jgi:gamma-glutamyl:cysteine ligase YbdK (ATP-grasp superfamily)